MSNKPTVTELVKAVTPFFPKMQLKIAIDSILNPQEEFEASSHYWIGILQSFKETFENMPKTYDTEPPESENEEGGNKSSAGDAIVYLHYFVGDCDWWITERDIEAEQLQAFGVVKLNNGYPELGYISIAELVDLDLKGYGGFPLFVELDFHWEPTKLRDIPALAGMFDKKR